MVANRVLLSCMLAGMLLLAGCLHAVDPPPGDEPGVEPKDTDGDGVLDADDLCADTPPATEVDSNGCETPSVQPDEDGDDVPDDYDDCPYTGAGESVDSSGCSPSQRDTDGDGVNDADDLCADTPPATEVDSDGCSPGQRDTDGDGVNDVDDLCADTPAGATVDPSGCTEEPEPPIPAQVGVGIHHITEFWSEQEQLNQTGALFIRINIVGTHFGNFVNDRSGYDWTELDSIVLPNADLVILATVYPTHSGLDSTANPKYPQTDSDKADFEAWLNALAGR